MHEQIKIMLMQVINDQAFGETESALQILAQALSLAQPGGYIRVFLDEGESLKTLLLQLNQALNEHTRGSPAQTGEILPGQPLDQLKPYITRLLASYAGPASVQEPDRVPSLGAKPALNSRAQPRQEMVEPLSQRELDVLRLVAQGFPDKMIAQTLTISRQTVHKHLVNIYSKLDVHNRTAAVARARALGSL